MPKYKPFPENSEVVDVLCCLILGYSNVKTIMKKLRQPQSTVSTKLKFLLENKIIKKNKWKFEPNWGAIVKIFQNETQKYFGDEKFDLLLLQVRKRSSKIDDKNKKLWKEIRDVVKITPNIFHKKRVVVIYEKYADYFKKGWLKKMSARELTFTYLDALKHIDTNKVKEFGEDTNSIKRLFNKIDVRDMKEDFFMQVEREMRR